jgi:signal transduction histidine kinase
VLVAALFQVLGARSAAGDGDVLRPLDLISYAILLAGPIALFWRHRFPVVVLAVASAASIAFATFAVPHWMFVVAPVIALFTLARAGRRRAAVAGAAAGYVAYLMVCWVFASELGVPERARTDPRSAVFLAVGLGLTIVLAGAAKVRAEQMAEMMKVRAERARAREEQERRQASEERLRIARELHDVLGHHLSLINVQAGVGLHLMDNRPEQAREALTAIKTASAEALREVRAVLGVLRPEEEAAPRQPPLGLDRLDELTADAGLPVTTKTTGDRRALPAAVDRAAYRIVQEALTNVRRHAAEGAAAEVSVEYAPATLRLSIRNDGPAMPAGSGPAGSGPAGSGPAGSGPAGSSAAGSGTDEAGRGGTGRASAADERAAEGGDGVSGGGSGIAGMQARAESLGGSLEAGALPGGGFLVAAVLPAPPGFDSGANPGAEPGAEPGADSDAEPGDEPAAAAPTEETS